MAALVAGAAALALADGAARPTRDDLDRGRRRAARVESELALASTRKPYIVLDLPQRVLRFRLMGMTMREIPFAPVEIHGLVAASGADVNAPRLAGIFTLREKEGDPRLNPLTPEQVEAGADDENVAAVFPPEPPKSYDLHFKQPVALVVSGEEPRRGAGRVTAWFADAAKRLFGDADDKEGIALRVALRLEPALAAEFWRSVIPEERWLILPPEGMALPDAGQEPPPKGKAPRAAPAAPARPPKKPQPDEGIPFRVPQPVEPPPANGGGDAATAPETAVPAPAPAPGGTGGAAASRSGGTVQRSARTPLFI